MDASFILTGYNKNSFSLVDSPLDNSKDITILMDKFLDISQCQYNDYEGSPVSLEDSSLLAQLPWFTPWADLFKPIEPVKVFQKKRTMNMGAD
jgi:hypothetical protein